MDTLTQDRPKGWLLKWDFALNAAAQVETLSKQITGPAPWALRDIQLFTTAAGGGNAAVTVQVQFPDGRFAQNVGEDSILLGGYGSWRRAFTREVLCPLGTKLSATLVDFNALNFAESIGIVFGGCYRFRPASLRTGAGGLPRYVPGANQNILAPCWMAGQGPQTPDGYVDRLHTYSNGDTPIRWNGAAQGAQTANIQLPYEENFRCRRVMLAMVPDPGSAPATFLLRIRAGSGYALMDDLIDVANLINAAPWAVDWDLPPGERIYFDLQLVDVVGGPQAPSLGNAVIYLEGVRRRKL